ncbi:hypothetical protein Ga0609869_000492 [Rhodovulum iodosum]|uniref:FHA domain-containing protein n=1 Tax=Rhodovulum iodosum TaxID=68291 RepID=A0ABV3XP90_9RHOB|nr:FHA domain-containing protein [Rhodovulum robiginosum]RSK31558.1 FHA domain-containing protein [Rhodovulum robiginosum]
MKLFRQSAAQRDRAKEQEDDLRMSTPEAETDDSDYGDRFAWRFEPEPQEDEPEPEQMPDMVAPRPRGGDRFAAAEQPFQSAMSRSERRVDHEAHGELAGLRQSLTAPDAESLRQRAPRTVAEPDEPMAGDAPLDIPTPLTGRADRRGGRVKTRLLGFDHQNGDQADPFAAKDAADRSADARFPVGWLVVMKGPGRGASFTLYSGVSQIGRGEDQAVRLDFGDDTISRSNHALLAYDSEQRKFFLGHGGKVNIVRLNDRPVLSTEEISGNDLIRIGETTLRFVAFCGSDFDWAAESAEPADDALLS